MTAPRVTQQEIDAVARAIFDARDVVSIPREGVEPAPFELVWQIDTCRAELRRQAEAAIEVCDKIRYF